MALQPLEPVGVEVVRRLVEEEDVEARKQDGRKRGAAGSPPDRPATGRSSRAARPSSAQTARARASRSAAAERQEAVERFRVGVDGIRVLDQLACEPVELSLRLGDAGTACQVLDQRLLGEEVTLLREVADEQVAGCASDRASVRLLEPGEHPEQCRLADAVRPTRPMRLRGPTARVTSRGWVGRRWTS